MELDERLIAKIEEYQPSPERLAAIRETPLLFLVGISGAGKNAITQKLLEQHPGQYHMIISHTTRAPRENHGVREQDGVAYHFVTFDTIDRMLDAKDFVEAKVVHAQNVYGTSITELEIAQATHAIAIGDIEIQGVQTYVDLGLSCKPIFILPPSYAVWQQRLRARYDGNIDEEDLRQRMETARQEIMWVLATKYFYLVINDDLQQAVDTIHGIMHGSDVAQRSQEAVQAAKDLLNGINDALA